LTIKKVTGDLKLINIMRYVVERTFGVLKRYHDLVKAKYMIIKRNQARLTISSIAHKE